MQQATESVGRPYLTNQHSKIMESTEKRYNFGDVDHINKLKHSTAITATINLKHLNRRFQLGSLLSQREEANQHRMIISA
jgi:hypothetical protein